MIHHNHTLNVDEFSWNGSALPYDIHYVHFECQLSCVTHPALYGVLLSFSPCISPDMQGISSEVRMTWFCSPLLFSCLFFFFPQLLLRTHLQLFGIRSFFSWSPRQIKSKGVEIGARSWSASGNILSWPLFFIRTLPPSLPLSLALSVPRPSHNYSPDLSATTLTESQMNTLRSLVWTHVTFADDQEKKLFTISLFFFFFLT